MYIVNLFTLCDKYQCHTLKIFWTQRGTIFLYSIFLFWYIVWSFIFRWIRIVYNTIFLYYLIFYLQAVKISFMVKAYFIFFTWISRWKFIVYIIINIFYVCLCGWIWFQGVTTYTVTHLLYRMSSKVLVFIGRCILLYSMLGCLKLFVLRLYF